MIVFVIGEEHQYALCDGFNLFGHPFHGRAIVMSFREFLGFRKLPVADYAFLDLERQTSERLTAVTKRFRLLKAALPGLRVLNPPEKDLTRLAVMDRLWRAGINRFRAIAATEIPDDLHYPVFLRRADDHNGPMTNLLAGRDALNTALAQSGQHPGDLILTEYIDARNANGLHEKRSCFRIGDAVFHASLDASRHWVCKGEMDDVNGVDLGGREHDFLAGTEDVADLRHVFDAAGITYGRADYARLADGSLAVFEINTNPYLDVVNRVPERQRIYSAVLMRRWYAALAAFSPEPERPGAPKWIEVGERLVLPRPVGRWRARALHGALSIFGQLHHESALRRRLAADEAHEADTELGLADAIADVPKLPARSQTRPQTRP